MKFYSGFSLTDESHFFENFIIDSDYCVCGFSYGAIKALKYVKEELERAQRVDTLQLFSPAFFQTKTEKFKRLQRLAYTKSKEAYLDQFIATSFLPYKRSEILHKETSPQELEELLEYKWLLSDLAWLHHKGVKIEVYLGGEDQIIDVNAARVFFLSNATVTYMKDANHFLQRD
ncbi:MAG: pimelyl-ACP methyl ester esterase BioV [Sulfurimonas sp.]|nr:pimelyl-ACP methyl ester esterase BioV [Sulfurimonas sp.]